MKKSLLSFLLLAPVLVGAQAVTSSWILNHAGKKGSFYFNNGGMPPTYTFTNMNDSADALKVCYTADTVWVRSHSVTDNMGKWMNPGGAVAQNWVHRFPRNPTVPVTKSISPKLAEIGLLVNGLAIYGLSNANSWTGTANATPQQGGQGVWNVEVGRSEGFVLDTAFGGHPQQTGAYHTHITPFRLYKNTPATQHSPIIGWAFDGYPIYGPYGYADPQNAASPVTRMKSGYSLRNITTRTMLPYGVPAPQTGPPVNATYPIGTYCEDYEWLAANGGDLDKYNGRQCITPEFPGGTYAYFVTMDAAGVATFPYYIGIEYYGRPDAGNFPAGPNGNGLSIPGHTTTCRTPTGNGVGMDGVAEGNVLQVYPNPGQGQVMISGNRHGYDRLTVVSTEGRIVYRAIIDDRTPHILALQNPGVYLFRFDDSAGSPAEVKRVVIQ